MTNSESVPAGGLLRAADVVCEKDLTARIRRGFGPRSLFEMYAFCLAYRLLVGGSGGGKRLSRSSGLAAAERRALRSAACATLVWHRRSGRSSGEGARRRGVCPTIPAPSLSSAASASRLDTLCYTPQGQSAAKVRRTCCSDGTVL
jgi:hypothetical protein